MISSYVFYGWWDWRFCFLMLASSLIDYFAGNAIHRSTSPRARRTFLYFAITANLTFLGVFKYFHFFTDSLVIALAAVGLELNTTTFSIILPVGISFYTFQTLSYTIDIYRRQFAPQKSLLDYLCFVSFFPQLVAGPIERAAHLLPQFQTPRSFSDADARAGLRLILWGLMKKMLVADNIGPIVDEAFNAPSGVFGSVLLLATVLFAFQIYCDFSAYSDIAAGTAKLFGIRLMRNFAYPYFSQSLTEFWRRWHISLSTWFRDYVYFPLGGNRVAPSLVYRNLLIICVVSGLWHGAAWTFVIWGLL
ncbi:MAG: MBOAT family O-acyltransferase, partial [Limisphaerales bacterium]